MTQPPSQPLPPQNSRLAADVQAMEATLPASATPAVPVEAHDPYAALRLPDYRRYFVGNAASLLATQMVGYTVGYELYQRTNSSLVLGLVGLAQIIPIVLFTLPAGSLVDRMNRRTLILMATSVQIFIFIAAGWSSLHAQTFWFARLAPHSPRWAGDPHVPIMYSVLFINGLCRSINQPAKATILPMLVPARLLSNAITWNSSLFEVTNVVGLCWQAS